MSDAASLPPQAGTGATKTRSQWKTLLLGVVYLLGGLSVWVGLSGGSSASVIGGLELILVALLAQNAKGMRSRIPLLNSSGWALQVIGWVFLLFLLAMLLAAVPSSPKDAETSEGTSGSPVPAAAPAQPKPTNTPAPTATPKPTNTPVPTATPKPSPTPVIGKRDAPVPYGSTYTVKDRSTTLEVQVTGVQFNAWPAVKKANSFNDAPLAGNDYIIVKLKIKSVAGSQDEPYKTDDGSYKFYADNRFWGAPGFGIVPQEPRLTGNDMFPGGTVEGWLGGRYLPVELMDQAVLVYKDVYFALR